MTSPADFQSAGRIIKYAYVDAGLLQEGQTPNSDQFVTGLQRLGDLINTWTIQDGLKLWTYRDVSIPLVAGTASYSLGPAGTILAAKPPKAVQGYYQDANSVRRPIDELAWADYLRLSNPTQQGAISHYHLDKQQANLVVTFWLVPDATAATGSAHLLVPQQITKPTSVTEDMAFPSEWMLPLRWGLADELSTGQPIAIQQKCQAKAQMYYEILSNSDVEEASTKFKPDHRMGGEGRFV